MKATGRGAAGMFWMAALLSTGCQMGTPADPAMRAPEAAGADPAVCHARHVTPAVIETVTEQVLAQPPRLAGDGSVVRPAVYRTETRQEIVRERQELRFEALCAEELTPEFVASLQRALAVRGHFTGPVTGRLDRATRRALRAYQKEQGLDSEILSLAAARRLGLKEVPREG
ncbi:peptidoglycan-binding domain-containing protein [Celeribacter indicus]|uniref:Lipoprotein n=1 Tax=Celeribacter indicus TaxID=1208324 RepID=A0A0B5E4D2_9RHOB|nr:peptidoglycan-binding domain-containing protein [Celeribacter indicus]AJE48215.1 lipoprotein [Celeribacter indicus]SDW69688.1 Putative peptidoglycan binding domain-containing protein [Celeribacter indicus]